MGLQQDMFATLNESWLKQNKKKPRDWQNELNRIESDTYKKSGQF